MNSWAWVILIGAVILGAISYRVGWLGKIRLPSWFGSSPESAIEKLEAQTERERGSAEELQKVLDAKRELMRARAASNKIRREIAETTEKTVDKELQAVKPRRL